MTSPATPRPGLADGIVVTPSHNPPDDGGFKYNPPNGGPADTDVTRWIQDEANRILEASGERRARRRSRACRSSAPAPQASAYDFLARYVDDLGVGRRHGGDRGSGLRIGVDPMGGASVAYWAAIGERYGLDLTVTNDTRRPDVRLHDPRLGREDPDGPVVAVRDGRARRRCATGSTSPSATTPTPTATASSCPGAGLLNPNHVLAAAISYLFGGGRAAGAATSRSARRSSSSSMIDRVVADLGRRLRRGPGRASSGSSTGSSTGSIGFGGEESAGASFLRRDGTVWTTDKDGIIACLLAAELTAKLRRNPAEVYAG